MSKKTRIAGMFKADPNTMMNHAIGAGIAVACGLIGRDRRDVLRAIDRSAALSERVSRHALQHFLMRAASGDVSETQFNKLLDDVIAMKDAS